VALVAFAAWPALAGAGEVNFYIRYAAHPSMDVGDVMSYAASSGENNHIAVSTPSASDHVTITDPARAMTPDPSNASFTESNCDLMKGSATCHATQGDDIGVRIYLGHGADTATVQPPSTFVEAKIYGGGGSDSLNSGAGIDTLTGGRGADALHGGGGFDIASYLGHTRPVRVTFDNVANDGQPGEHDNVHRDIEGAWGGNGDDVLKGDSQTNLLFGKHGADRIIGRGGADGLEGGSGPDHLRGGTGLDVLSGGPARDVIQAADGQRDLVFCHGKDRVIADSLDHLTCHADVVR
jgi:hypothetical protein